MMLAVRKVPTLMPYVPEHPLSLHLAISAQAEAQPRRLPELQLSQPWQPSLQLAFLPIPREYSFIIYLGSC
jgi:hypothetical protein